MGFALLSSAPSAWGITGEVEPEGPEFVVAIGCCTGVLISPEWILTAQHVGKKVAPGTPVRFGDQASTVETVSLSPSYTGTSSLRVPISDIALIKLTKPIHISQYPTLGKQISKSARTRLLSQAVEISAYPSRPAPENEADANSFNLKRAGLHSAKTKVHFQYNQYNHLYPVIDANDGHVLQVGNSGSPMLLNGTIVIGIAHSSGPYPGGKTYGFYWFPGTDKQWIDRVTNAAAKWTNIR